MTIKCQLQTKPDEFKGHLRSSSKKMRHLRSSNRNKIPPPLANLDFPKSNSSSPASSPRPFHNDASTVICLDLNKICKEICLDFGRKIRIEMSRRSLLSRGTQKKCHKKSRKYFLKTFFKIPRVSKISLKSHAQKCAQNMV